jgi:hypothetical protein
MEKIGQEPPTESNEIRRVGPVMISDGYCRFILPEHSNEERISRWTLMFERAVRGLSRPVDTR